MIPLLSELERWESGAALPDDPEHRRALRLLEWHRIAAQVARHARSRRAAARLAARRPFARMEPILLQRELADELRPRGERGEWPPLVEVGDALDLLDRPRPLRLAGAELVHLAATAVDLDHLRDDLIARERDHPRWCGAARCLQPLSGLAGAVARALDRDGGVRDDASPLLSRLRREARDQERQARAAVQRAMADARERGWTTATEVTLRGDRLCLPVRSGSKRQVDGIVHDRSATGGTLFIEPAAVVALQNDLIETRLAAAAEAERILLELNRAAEASAPALREACELCLRVDETRSALLWSRAVRGARPALAAGGELDIRAGRHPLLLDRAGADVVPLDLAMPDGARILVISGPNAGGKSVALKCTGLLCLLAQCGWDVPAREDTRLPLLGRLEVDLGDDQSIARSLSSFSAHLSHLAGFLDRAGGESLVLCDEIGSGTDPDEGTALAFTVLEALAERGALVLATTHSGLLKAAVADHPSMANAAMDFDETNLAPLYTLRAGVPGASHAFAIASRLDFPAGLVERARARVGEDRFRIEHLLTELGARARDLQQQQSEARRLAEAARAGHDALAARLAGIERERADALAAARRAGEDFLAEARRTLERLVRELRGEGPRTRTIRDARDELAGLGAGLPPEAPRAPVAAPVAGDRVRVPHLGLDGRVVEVRGGRLVVLAGGMRLSLPADAVAGADGGGSAAAPPPPGASRHVAAAGGAGVTELDLRGFRAEEGWEALDRLIDRAIPAGTGEIGVIHGFGTGRLRAYLLERLARDPRVAGFQDAPPDQGGQGRTVVRLA
ncbi:MAG: Smr/MutS family protein [bacterium]|nr:Smr/MutS family protein [bacterium]